VGTQRKHEGEGKPVEKREKKRGKGKKEKKNGKRTTVIQTPK